jgi:non-homologous end joining protein Ku
VIREAMGGERVGGDWAGRGLGRLSFLRRRRAKFDPAAFGDRYQDAPRELVGGKLKGVAQAPSEVAEPSKVVNLMDALKRSLAQEAPVRKPSQRRGRSGRKRLLSGGNQGC